MKALHDISAAETRPQTAYDWLRVDLTHIDSDTARADLARVEAGGRLMTRLVRRSDQLRMALVRPEGVALTVTPDEFYALRGYAGFRYYVEGQRIDRMTFMGYPLLVVPDA